MPTAGPAPARLADASGTLKLLAYLALAVLLMAVDHRGSWLGRVRLQASVVVEPVWWLAALPSRLIAGTQEMLATRGTLRRDNARLSRDLKITAARLHRLEAVARENERLRDLLGGTRGYRLNVQFANLVDIDLDPTRQRVLLDLGGNAGVRVGQALIDAGGLVGQVIEVTPRRATALLITDPDHAVPVQVARTGLRLIAYGTGSPDRLRVPNVPQSGDIRIGDALVTSGIGGGFPAGFPVGTVSALQPDDSRAFVIADVQPAARLARGAEVLLVSNAPAPPEAGPPVPPEVRRAQVEREVQTGAEALAAAAALVLQTAEMQRGANPPAAPRTDADREAPRPAAGERRR